MILPSRAEWRRILLEATVIAALGAVLGLSVHYSTVLDALSVHGGRDASPTAGAGYPMPVLLDETRTLLAAGALAVDARDRDSYREGHLPGAVSLPVGLADAELPRFRSRVPADRILVVYCSGLGCPDSFDLAVRLTDSGYQDVRVFEEGLPSWRDAGLPVVEGER